MRAASISVNIEHISDPSFHSHTLYPPALNVENDLIGYNMRLWSHFLKNEKVHFEELIFTLLCILQLDIYIVNTLKFLLKETIYFSSRVNGPGVISLNI